MFQFKLPAAAALLLSAAMLMTGCTISVDGEEVEIDIADETEVSSEEVALSGVTATATDIEVAVGKISVEYGDNDSMKLVVKYKATGHKEEELQEILEEVKTEAEVNGDELKVRVMSKNKGINIWDWIEDEYGSLNKPNLDVNLDITLPNSIQEFNVSCDVGNIDLDSLKGCFDISTDVGNIDMSDVTFAEDSEITVDVGKITCDLSEEPVKDTKVTLTSDVGDIHVNTSGQPYEKESSNTEDFVGASETIVINELCTIDASTSVGKLVIKK